MRPSTSLAACVFALLLVASPLNAQPSPTFTSPTAESFSSPRPSGLLPRGLFDPSRFSIHNSLQVGYTSGGPYGGSAGLFTSSLGYRVTGNALLRVDIGAHMNPAFGGDGRIEKGIFLQSAAFDWKPTHNSLVRVEYRDMRSPLQYGYGGYGYGYSPYGYGYQRPLFREDEAPLGSGLPGDPLRN